MKINNTLDHNNIMNIGASYYSGGAIFNSCTANVHFNRIIGNIGSYGSAIYNTSSGTLDASLNWWGNISYSNLIRITITNIHEIYVTIPKSAIKDYADNNLMATYTFKFRTGA